MALAVVPLFYPALPINESEHSEITLNICQNNFNFHGLGAIYNIIVPSFTCPAVNCVSLAVF